MTPADFGPVYSTGRTNRVDGVRQATTVVSRVDVHETPSVQLLNAMNEGIRSLRDIDFHSNGIARLSALLSMNLHSNQVSTLEGLSPMTVSTILTKGRGPCEFALSSFTIEIALETRFVREYKSRC